MLNGIMKETVSTAKYALKDGAMFYGMNKVFSAVNVIANNYLGSKLPAQAVTAIAGLGLAVAVKKVFKGQTAREAADMAAVAAVVTILQSTPQVESAVNSMLAPVLSIGAPSASAPATNGYFLPQNTRGYMLPSNSSLAGLRQSGMRGLTSKHSF